MSATSQVVRVQFHRLARPESFHLERPTRGPVVAQTRRGPMFGWIVAEEGNSPPGIVADCRPATAEDLRTHAEKRLFAAEVAEFTRAQALALDLPLLVLGGLASLDAQHVVIYFAAEHRVDFRELLSRLQPRYGKKVELHQLSERERAQISGPPDSGY